MKNWGCRFGREGIGEGGGKIGDNRDEKGIKKAATQAGGEKNA